jgi:hypothetical protein
MTDPTQHEERSEEAEAAAADEEYEDDQPRNPFDNPWFLPLMLGAFALWCGYDGFLSDEFVERPGTLWFNRIAFAVLGTIAAWLAVRARREMQAARDEG